MPSASKLLGDLVSSAGAISVTSGVANTAITGTITTAQIADDAITTAKVAANAIVTADIADGNVTAAKLANTAVTAGVYGGSSNSALITVDSQGRITAASNVSATAGGLNGFTVYTSGTTAFTVPAGVTKILVEVVGGGGGASLTPSHTGGGGGYAKGMLTVTPGQTINAVVGAVGTTGSGGTTSFSTISATGGTKAATGLGGSGSGGAFNITGGNANNSDAANGAGGAGGGMNAQSVVLAGCCPVRYYLRAPDLYKGFGTGNSWNGCAANGYGGSGGIILLTY